MVKYSLGDEVTRNMAAVQWINGLFLCRLFQNEACGKLAFVLCVYVFPMDLLLWNDLP